MEKESAERMTLFMLGYDRSGEGAPEIAHHIAEAVQAVVNAVDEDDPVIDRQQIAHHFYNNTYAIVGFLLTQARKHKELEVLQVIANNFKGVDITSAYAVELGLVCAVAELVDVYFEYLALE